MSWFAGAVVAGMLAANVHGTPVFELQDPDINESSGLVDLGSLMVTTNDSGGGPVVFVVDARSGRTVSTTRFADEVEDVEALAPAGGDAVWVGDIGDNLVKRRSVQVYRVPVGRTDRVVDAPRYDLVYPDGSHDAESLLVGPDGRLRIITKNFLGGRVYVAPKNLDPDRPNKLRAGPQVDLYATDAAMFPDGKHVLVRGYGGALVLTFPAFAAVGQFGLPSQEQGEGVSVGRSGRVRLSSEGVHAPVLQIKVPADVRRKMSDPTPAAADGSGGGLDEDGVVVADEAQGIDWSWVGLGALGVGAVALFLSLARRRR